MAPLLLFRPTDRIAAGSTIHCHGVLCLKRFQNDNPSIGMDDANNNKLIVQLSSLGCFFSMRPSVHTYPWYRRPFLAQGSALHHHSFSSFMESRPC